MNHLVILIKPFKLAALGLLLFLANSSISQTSYNALKSKWDAHPNDTSGINAGLKLHIFYYRDFNDSTVKEKSILLKLYKQAQKINYKEGLIEITFALGNHYLFHNSNKLAISNYYTSLKLSEQYKFKQGITKATMGIGLVCYNQMNYTMAIDFFKNALNVSKLSNDKQREATLKYLIGLCLIELKKYDDAKLNLDSSMVLRLTFTDTKTIKECELGIANIFKEKEQFDTAVKIYNRLMPLFLNEKESVAVSLIYSALAEINLKQKKYNLAVENGKKALEYANMTGHTMPTILANKVNYEIYIALNDYEKSLKYFTRYNNVKDSVQNLDFVTQLSLAQANYDFEKKEASIKTEQERRELKYNLELKAKNRNQIILSFISLLSILFVIVVIFAYRYTRKQKKISEDLLLNILPAETTLELKKFGRALPKNHNGVAIIFCDVKNFTTIAEKLTPEMLVKMLDTYFKQFDTICANNGIEKIKTIGDAYMCVAGLNQSVENPSKNAIDAALQFLEFAKQIQDDMMEQFNQAFQFRIGIHTGNIVSGVVGLKKYAYDIWGDAVNTAARMEQNSESGKINVSGNTYEATKTHFNFTYRGMIEAKNKGEIDMYFVVPN